MMWRPISILGLSFSLGLFADLHAETIVPGGDVSGTWTAAGSPYLVQADITVPVDSALFIGPGVDAIFQGYYRLTVSGILTVTGTASDSIRFVPSDTSTGWRGLYFNQFNTVHHLSYCDIEYARESGIYMHSTRIHLYVNHCTVAHCRNTRGAGILEDVLMDTLEISHSTIAFNTAEADDGGKGGGIYMVGYSLMMDSCTVHGNRAVIPTEQYVNAVKGGGIYLGNAAAGVITGSVISDNFLGLSDGGESWGGYSSDPQGEFGAGIYTESSSPVVISGCRVTDNFANVHYGGGGGIFTHPNSWPLTISQCEISHNRLAVYGASLGGGLHAQSSTDVSNCTFYANDHSAMWLNGQSQVFSFRNTIVAHNASGIRFGQQGSTLTTGYNDVTDACTQMPAGFGVLDRVNANGDSCDMFYNIFLEPIFADTANGDLHLQAGSPCIDAGDPTSPYDPDGTVVDMGAYYFDQLIAVPEAIHDLTIHRTGNDVSLRWSPVSLDTQGHPITVSYYVIYAADEPFVISEGDSLGYVAPPDTMFVHTNAVQQLKRFYNVKAMAGQ